MSSSGRIRVAIAGVGHWGYNLVRTFAHEPRAQITWLCDLDARALERARALAPDARQTARVADLLEAGDVDAVVIATPAASHAELACQALAAGRHVLVEKPVALSLADAERVASAGRATERVLMVGHLMLYHPVVEHLRGLIAAGELGDILYLYSTRVNLGRARTDENALWSFGPHDLSMIDYLLPDAAIARVSATGKCYLRPNIEDVVFLNIEFAGGQMAHVHMSWLDPRKERRLTVVGTHKMAVFDDTSPDKLSIYDKGYDRPPSFTDFGEYLTLRSGGVHLPHVRMVEPLAVECGHFIDCIRSGAPPRSNMASALRVQRVLDLAQRALDAAR